MLSEISYFHKDKYHVFSQLWKLKQGHENRGDYWVSGGKSRTGIRGSNGEVNTVKVLCVHVWVCYSESLY
jgi:hypothetical protein